MNDIRDRKRIKTLPDDLKKIADEMLAEKFDLPSTGEVVAKEKIPFDYGDPASVDTHTYLSPNLLKRVHEGYYQGREKGYRPANVFLNPHSYQALLRDPNAIKYMSSSIIQNPTIMGMNLKSMQHLEEGRIIMSDDIDRICFDSRDENQRNYVPF